MLKKLLVGVCLLFAPVLLYGQSAQLSGYVKDSSGGSVANASVELRDQDTGVRQQVRTNSEGIYNLAFLKPGTYVATVQAKGFKTLTREKIVLSIDERASVDFSLEVGAVSEVVTIQGGGLNLNTSDGSVSTLVDEKTVANMPLNGRSFQDLILLTPGVTTNSPQLGGGGAAAGQTGEFSVNGQRTEANYYTVDGVSANVGSQQTFIASGGGLGSGLISAGAISSSTALGTTQALVSVDDLQEFRVQSSTYSAEYGRTPGGQFAFETRSGTNQWHGTGFDYLRNNYFDANDWFNSYLGVPSPALRQNDFGGTLGGPVRIPGVYNGKDKTFFFVNYEGLRLTQPQVAGNGSVPDACMRGLAPVNSSGQCLLDGAPILGPCQVVTGAPPAGSSPCGPTPTTVYQEPRRPAGFTNPDGSYNPAGNPALQAILRLFPMPLTIPEFDSEDGTGLDRTAFSSISSINSTSIRFDQVITDKMTAFFRFSDTNSSVLSPSYETVNSTALLNRTYTGAVDNIFSSQLSNDFRINYSLNTVGILGSLVSNGGNSPLPGAGFDMAKFLDIPEGSSMLFGYNSNGAQFHLSSNSTAQDVEKQWNIVDTVSYTVGAHQLKFGVDYRRVSSAAQPAPAVLQYQFVGEPNVETGEVGAFPNNPVGALYSSQNAYYPLTKNFSAFANDSWKVSHRLTLSFGLRWEVNPAVGVTQGLLPYTIANAYQNPNNWALSQENTPGYATTWFNFAPRLGAAYIVRNTPGWETVVRGGFGVFFDTGQGSGLLGFSQGPGYSALSFFFAGAVFPVDPHDNIPVVPTSRTDIINGPPPHEIVGFSPHLQLPYTLQWNVSVEQALGKSQALTISYVGSHGSRLLETNQYIPSANNNAQTFDLIQNGLTSDYDALQVQYQRRLARGLTVLGSYTWSHCIDYGSVNFDIGYQRGNCDFDIRNNLSVAVSYDLPNVGSNKIVRAIVDHWGIDDRFTARTPFPLFLVGGTNFTPTGQVQNASFDVALDANNKPIAPYLYGANCNAFFGPLLGKEGVPDVCPGGKAINPCAFLVVNPGSPSTPLPYPGFPALHDICGRFGYEQVGDGGTAPRNQLRGDSAVQMDLAIRREFPIYDRLKLQFRAEVFNIFNHPNFGEFDTSSQDFGFGLNTGTLSNSLGVLSQQYQMGGPRSMQFALKLIF